MEKTSLAQDILEGLLQLGEDVLFALPRPLETKHAWTRRLMHTDPDSYRHALRRLKKQGYVQIVSKQGKKFIHLTSSGELELLMKKVGVQANGVWDKKWRIIMFDIPERSKEKRTLLRWLLKRNNFFKLQASVYITPYALNREAVSFLNKSGLTEFIRILRVDEIDDDRHLRKKFGL